MRPRWEREDGVATLVQAALIMPLLAFALGCLLHLGLYLLSRQVVITAVQQGVTTAASADGTTGQGEEVARQLINDHSAAQVVGVEATSAATSVRLSVTVQTPAVVPGLTRAITVAQSATREQWIAP